MQADFGQLRQACVNIVLNAMRGHAQGGGTLRIALARTRTAPVEVAVADTGTGIPPEHLAKIFDPFFTTKEKGTGLGLSVVYGIVERHGGRIDLEQQGRRGHPLRDPAPRAGGRPGRPRRERETGEPIYLWWIGGRMRRTSR